MTFLVYADSAVDYVETRDPWVWDVDAWKQCDEVYVFDSGAWKRFYVRELAGALSVNTSGGTYAGDTTTISGALFAEGVPVTSADGDILVEAGYNDGSWSTVGTATLNDQGQYSISHQENSAGDRYYRATFQPTPQSYVLPTQQTSAKKHFALRTPSISKGSVTTTSFSCSCGSVTGATRYYFSVTNTSSQSSTSRNLSRTGLSNNTQYAIKVRAEAVTPNGTVYSSYSGTITARTGRAEQRDSGTSGWIYCYPIGRGQYRRDVGWGYVGSDMRQGWYSSSYGGAGYFGIADYSTGLRSAIDSAIGSTRRDKGSCKQAEVYMYREGGVGPGGGVTLRFAASDRGVGGSEPNSEGAWHETASQGQNSGAWETCGWENANRIGKYWARSLLIRNDNGFNVYGSWNGGDTGRIRVTWTWDYVTVTAVSSTWL